MIANRDKPLDATDLDKHAEHRGDTPTHFLGREPLYVTNNIVEWYAHAILIS